MSTLESACLELWSLHVIERHSKMFLPVNSLSPDTKRHILLTVLHTFHMELVRRTCLNIKTYPPW